MENRMTRQADQRKDRLGRREFLAGVAATAALVVGLTVSAVALVREQHARRLAMEAQEKEAGERTIAVTGARP